MDTELGVTKTLSSGSPAMKKDQVLFAPDMKTVVRRREGKIIGTGILTPVKDGAPIAPGAELVSVDALESEGWHDIETIYKNETRVATSGPPQVATPAYRMGYDRIFGKKEVGLA